MAQLANQRHACNGEPLGVPCESGPEPEVDPGYAHRCPDGGQSGAAPALHEDHDGGEEKQDSRQDDKEFQGGEPHTVSMTAVACAGQATLAQAHPARSGQMSALRRACWLGSMIGCPVVLPG